MSDFKLQTEITARKRREIELQSERNDIEAEMRLHKKKIKQHFYAFFSALCLNLLFQSLASFFFGYPTNFFFFFGFGIVGLIDSLWLFAGRQKLQRKLEEWKKIAGELESK